MRNRSAFRFPIKWKMTLGFLSVNLISLLFMFIFSHYYFGDAIKNDFSKMSVEAAGQLNHHMEFYFKQIIQSTSSLIRNEQIQRYLSNSTEADTQDIELELIKNMGNNYPEIIGMFIMSRDGDIVSAFGKYYNGKKYYLEEPWYNFRFLPKFRFLRHTGSITLNIPTIRHYP